MAVDVDPIVDVARFDGDPRNRGSWWPISAAMPSFQRLEVYQRSVEFLALALEIIADLPSKGHADIADQLRRAAQSQPPERYDRGIALLTSVVAMLTKMI